MATSTHWTLLSNHGHVLLVLAREPDLRLRDVATRVGITERAVQRIVRELSEGNYLEVSKDGRRNHYRLVRDAPLRHAVERGATVGDLLDLIDCTTLLKPPS
ncbi:MAG: DNA-binding IscR family transcriptional regulator [Myxococcota bacterium]|jgi:DNA-binding IscR family transcriptional regulator